MQFVPDHLKTIENAKIAMAMQTIFISVSDRSKLNRLNRKANKLIVKRDALQHSFDLAEDRDNDRATDAFYDLLSAVKAKLVNVTVDICSLTNAGTQAS